MWHSGEKVAFPVILNQGGLCILCVLGYCAPVYVYLVQTKRHISMSVCCTIKQLR